MNELGRWEMEFGVHVKTYDQVLEKKNNVTKAKWIPGGEIVIGPHVRLGRGKYGRVSKIWSRWIALLWPFSRSLRRVQERILKWRLRKLLKKNLSEISG